MLGERVRRTRSSAEIKPFACRFADSALVKVVAHRLAEARSRETRVIKLCRRREHGERSVALGCSARWSAVVRHLDAVMLGDLPHGIGERYVLHLHDELEDV